MQHDTFDNAEVDAGPGMSILTAGLYGLGSLWNGIAVINNPEPQESIVHLIIRLMPSLMIGAAALLQGYAAYRKSLKSHD